MKLLFSSPSEPEVGLLKNLLEENGIAAEIRNASVHSNFPGAAFQPEIWILNDEHYPKACELRDVWSQPSIARGALAQDGESRPTMWFVCAVCLGGAIILAWQGFRAKTWVPFVGAGLLLGITALCYNVIRHLPPPNRSKKPGNS